MHTTGPDSKLPNKRRGYQILLKEMRERKAAEEVNLIIINNKIVTRRVHQDKKAAV
jgi:hypothetical protein